ncbi:hypothetical protein [Microbacterium sp. YJN-G]|nr:hypothetical protein [Microbacterium sp. YJN-G]
MSSDISEHAGAALPFVCADCGTSYRYAIAASMCCDPAAPGPDD